MTIVTIQNNSEPGTDRIIKVGTVIETIPTTLATLQAGEKYTADVQPGQPLAVVESSPDEAEDELHPELDAAQNPAKPSTDAEPEAVR